MANRRKKQTKTISLAVGNDQSSWRYASLEEALNANTSILAQLIKAGQEKQLRQEVEGAKKDISAVGD